VTPVLARGRLKLRSKKPRLYIRKFINKPGHHTVASVLLSVDKGSTTFIIADCNRMINLDFDSYTKVARKNSLYKAQALIDALTQFKAAMEAEFLANPDAEYD
jgi:hypothetical protein